MLGNVIEHTPCPACGMCWACGNECAEDCPGKETYEEWYKEEK
jgi:hypothetical protein